MEGEEAKLNWDVPDGYRKLAFSVGVNEKNRLLCVKPRDIMKRKLKARVLARDDFLHAAGVGPGRHKPKVHVLLVLWHRGRPSPHICTKHMDWSGCRGHLRMHGNGELDAMQWACGGILEVRLVGTRSLHCCQ